MSPYDKPLIWLKGEIKTPPMSKDARVEAGFLLRRLQRGESLFMPHSAPMPSIGPGCHELRVRDVHGNWRVMYRVDPDAIVILEVLPQEDADHATIGAGCLQAPAGGLRQTRLKDGYEDASYEETETGGARLEGRHRP
jgi:hypothetical protein